VLGNLLIQDTPSAAPPAPKTTTEAAVAAITAIFAPRTATTAWTVPTVAITALAAKTAPPVPGILQISDVWPAAMTTWETAGMMAALLTNRFVPGATALLLRNTEK
jgi:hypothetical protein